MTANRSRRLTADAIGTGMLLAMTYASESPIESTRRAGAGVRREGVLCVSFPCVKVRGPC